MTKTLSDLKVKLFTDGADKGRTDVEEARAFLARKS